MRWVRFSGLRLGLVVVFGGLAGCRACDGEQAREDEPKGVSTATAGLRVPAGEVAKAEPPRLLYLPSGEDEALPGQHPELFPQVSRTTTQAGRCTADMVDIRGEFCIDRYEARLVDKRTNRPLSPYYPPDPALALSLREHWEHERFEVGDARARSRVLPNLPEWQTNEEICPMAVSRQGELPSGYLDGHTAARTCEAAGKRLCTPDEWVIACRGEQNQDYPYGPDYVARKCNVFRSSHPAQVLHQNASIGHLDPRLNQVQDQDGALLYSTGQSTECRSTWGNDAVFDMVGNLDEWVDDAKGAFHGGFYARSTKLGCRARITTHPREYRDYSLGVRCCR